MNKKRTPNLYESMHKVASQRSKGTTPLFYKRRTRMSHAPKSSDKYTKTPKKLKLRPDYHFSHESIVLPPYGFNVPVDDVGEAADLADDSYFHQQLNRLKTRNPNIIHSKLKNAKVDKDVILYQNSGIQRGPKSNEDEYDDDDDTDSEEYVEQDSGEPNNDDADDYDEAEEPVVNTDYEIIDEEPLTVRPRPAKPNKPVHPKPRDPTLAVVNAGRTHRTNKLSPRRRHPPAHIPCNHNISSAHHRKTITSTRQSIVKSTKKFHTPDELYAEIAKIIDTKRRNYKRPGHDKTHWELKIVPSQHEDDTRK